MLIGTHSNHSTPFPPHTNSCNELNGAYAADGYARAHGVSAMFTTYTVGGLSAINAVAGAYSDGALGWSENDNNDQRLSIDRRLLSADTRHTEDICLKLNQRLFIYAITQTCRSS
jgi:hypothetical protein